MAGQSEQRFADSQVLDSSSIEENRIRAVYAKRQGDSRYSWFNAGQLFLIQELELRLLPLLTRCGCANLADKTILAVGCSTGY